MHECILVLAKRLSLPKANFIFFSPFLIKETHKIFSPYRIFMNKNCISGKLATFS